MRLFLIRHGQTEWNVLQKAQGHSDIPLDDLGLKQAESLAKHFSSLSLQFVFSSDLIRSADTARPLAEATGAKLILTSLLRERSFGDWEGLNYPEIRERIATLGPDPGYAVPPGGESMAMVHERLDNFLENQFKTCEAAAVVSHGGTSSALLAHLLGTPPGTGRAFRFSNTGVSELRKLPTGGWILEKYNDTSHLAQEALQRAHGIIG